MFVMVLVMTALVVNAQRTPVKVTDLQKSLFYDFLNEILLNIRQNSKFIL